MEQQKKKTASNKTGIAISLAIFACFFLLLAWLIHSNYEKKLALVSSGIQTSAVITQKSCQDHGAVRYSFVVNGVEYSRKGYNCVDSCSAANVGDTIEIKYLSSHPSINECGLISGQADIVLQWFIFIGILVAGFCVFLFKFFGKIKAQNG